MQQGYVPMSVVPIEITRERVVRIIRSRIGKIANQHVHPSEILIILHPSGIKITNDGSRVHKVPVVEVMVVVCGSCDCLCQHWGTT